MNILGTAYRVLSNRAYVRWLFVYLYCRSARRYTERKIKYQNNIFYVADCASFVWQLKEIFVHEYYNFVPRKRKPVIIDCGANIGTSCVYFAKTFPGATVIAFEADPNIYRLLLKNIKINKITNVEPINKAVWIDNSGIGFGIEGADAGSIYYPENVLTVPSVRLKDYLTEEIDLLKLDIEGAEGQVIIDCQDRLINVNNCFIEFHSLKDNEQNLGAILDVLRSCGFRYYIESAHKKDKPFCSWDETGIFDLRLNIYASRRSLSY